MLDTIEWSLTDDDELSLPTIVGGPDVLKRLEDVTEEERASLDELMRSKHEELLARRRRRRLS
jgi:hypothetical protein